MVTNRTEGGNTEQLCRDDIGDKGQYRKFWLQFHIVIVDLRILHQLRTKERDSRFLSQYFKRLAPFVWRRERSDYLLPFLNQGLQNFLPKGALSNNDNSHLKLIKNPPNPPFPSGSASGSSSPPAPRQTPLVRSTKGGG